LNLAWIDASFDFFVISIDVEARCRLQTTKVKYAKPAVYNSQKKDEEK
jgi:hypothetical protein